MPNELPTIWEATAHTFAKHQILQAYLNAWMPIMSKQSHRRGASGMQLLFVDGFAGPGSYVAGQEGSPILALKSVLDHSHDFPVPVDFLFIEQLQERFTALTDTINQYRYQAEVSPRIKSITAKQGDCKTVLNSYLDDLEKTQRNLGPAFFFLDQFGYSDVPMQLIQRIMNHPQCEVFSYLNWARMNQFLTDETKWSAITNAFGGDDWRPVLQLLPAQKPAFILTTYRDALKTRASAKYVWHFAMCDKNDKLIYWLFFCTNSLRGLEEMKRAMWTVDPTGGFRFSDKDNPSQLHLFKNYTAEILAQELPLHFQSHQPTLHQVKEFVLTETPAYLYKNALKLLEEKQLLKVSNPPPRRRRGTFPNDDMQFEFLDYSAP
jgi:three-Cys-motif partner protein